MAEERLEVSRYGGCWHHPRVPPGTYPPPPGAPPGYPRPDWYLEDEETGYRTSSFIGIPPELKGEERRRYEDEQRPEIIAEFEEMVQRAKERRRLEAEQKEKEEAEAKARLEALVQERQEKIKEARWLEKVERLEKLERRKMRKEKLMRVLGLESGKG